MPEQKSLSAWKFLLTTRKYLLSMFRDIFQTHGDIFDYQFAKKHFYFVKHPQYFKHILLDNHENYVKGEQFDAFTPLLGEGLISVRDHQQWKGQRHTLSDSFHNQHLAKYAELIPVLTEEMLAMWPKKAGETSIVDITAAMEKLAFRSVAKTILGINIPEQMIDEVYENINAVFNYLGSRLTPLDKLRQLPGWRQCQKRIKFLENFFNQLIIQCEQGIESSEFISKLLTAFQEQKIYKSHQHIREEIMTIFLTGYETVSTLLTWVWILLSKYPDVERILAAELKDVLNGRLPTYDDLAKLKYMQAVIKETLRLYPPGWIVVRQAVNDDEIAGQKIHKNANIIIFIYFLHQHPDFWINPQGFDPQRFMQDQPELKHIYCPFGMGPRSCIGSGFATMEAQLILATIVQKYQLELLPGYIAEPVPGLTLKPASGNLWMRIRKKQFTEEK